MFPWSHEKIPDTFILASEAMKKFATSPLKQQSSNMLASDIHIQVTTFLHVHKDYLLCDSAKDLLIHNSFMRYLSVS